MEKRMIMKKATGPIRHIRRNNVHIMGIAGEKKVRDRKYN